MSGGSYNYLTSVLDLQDLVTRQHDLEAMADRLDGLSEIEFPGAHAAARMTRDLLAKLRLWDAHAQATTSLMSDVWKSVEWWDSNDWGPDQVRVDLDKLLTGEPQ